MAAPLRYHAESPDRLLVAPMDAFTAVYHRPSGITHLLTEPAPQLLAMLQREPATIDDLLARLATSFDLADADRPALTARLDELVAAGLVRPA